MRWLKWGKRGKQVAVHRVYVDREANLAFCYYSGKIGSFSRTLRFVEEYAPKFRDRFAYGGRGGIDGLLYDGKLITKDVYFVAKGGVIEILNRQCIEFLYGGKIALKI